MLTKVKKAFQKSLQWFLGKLGFAIVRIKPASNSLLPRGSMRGAISTLSERGVPVHTIIDIGASDGHWTEMTMEYFPTSKYLLIEAQDIHQKKLDCLVRNHPNVQYCLSAAGDKEGQIFFDAGNPFGGQASYEPYAVNNIEVKVTTVDLEVQRRGLKGPYLLKLDTHGFEVPILRGAAHVLQKTQAVVIECYVQHLMKDSLTFYQMCAYFDTLGFRCIDAVDPEWRPYDNTLWQMDLVFIRNDRIEFEYHDYV